MKLTVQTPVIFTIIAPRVESKNTKASDWSRMMWIGWWWRRKWAPAPTCSACTNGMRLPLDLKTTVCNALASVLVVYAQHSVVRTWQHTCGRIMLSSGEWGAGDDYALVQSMLACTKDQGVEYEYQVQWEELVPNRAGAVARRRWRDLTKQVPKRHDKELPELAEALSQMPRYFNWEGAGLVGEDVVGEDGAEGGGVQDDV